MAVPKSRADLKILFDAGHLKEIIIYEKPAMLMRKQSDKKKYSLIVVGKHNSHYAYVSFRGKEREFSSFEAAVTSAQEIGFDKMTIQTCITK